MPRRGKLKWGKLRVGAVLLAAATGYFAALVPYGLNVDDEGTLLYQIYRTYRGEVPYRDFHAGYTPGIFYWNAALFHLFGVHVFPIRLSLALANGVAVYGLYWIARRLGTPLVAAPLAGVLYLAMIPFYDGQFAAFNIPYPIWYSTLFWVLSVGCAIRWWCSGSRWWWLVAGAAAGFVFSFKPNSGLLDLAALLVALTGLQRPAAAQGSAPWWFRALSRCERLLRGATPVAIALMLTVFLWRGAGQGGREVRIFALPLLVLVGFQLVGRGAKRLSRRAGPLSILLDLFVLGLGFAIPTLPWTVYFIAQVGAKALLRAVLFVGTGFDRFYFLPYPHLGLWEVGLTAVTMIAAVAGVLLRRRVLPAPPVVVALGFGALGAGLWFGLHPPPMVEGFQASVVMRVRHLAFGALLLVQWLGIGAYAIATARRRGPGAPALVEVVRPGDCGFAQGSPRNPGRRAEGSARRRERSGTLFIVLAAATAMHMQLYPRTDFMHLVPSAPGLLALASWMIGWGARSWSKGLAVSPSGRRAARVTFVLPVWAVVAVLLAPALMRIEYLVRARLTGRSTAVVRLENDRAPLVIEAGAGRLFRSLGAAARYIAEHSQAGDYVFTFPALDVVDFLAGRRNPTRHGYFFPGWPGHDVEAEVIDTLRVRPPRYVVSLHDHAFYFIAAPVYYFNLRRFITSRYELEARVGLFDILAVRPDLVQGEASERAAHPAGEFQRARLPAKGEGYESAGLEEAVALWRAELANDWGAVAAAMRQLLAALPPKSRPEDLARAVADTPPSLQNRFVWLVRKSRSPAGAEALAHILAREGPDAPVLPLAVRVLAEVGGLRCVPPLLELLDRGDVRARGAIAGVLFTIASRAWIEGYWYAPRDESDYEAIEERIGMPTLITWLDNPWEFPALRSFAIRISAHQGERAVLPFLVRILGDANEQVSLRVDAAHSLVELGYGSNVLRAVADLLDWDPLVPAVLLARLYSTNPAATRRELVRKMASESEGVRTQVFWVAAGLGDPELRSALEAGLSDSAEAVRLAALWGLGQIRQGMLAEPAAAFAEMQEGRTGATAPERGASNDRD